MVNFNSNAFIIAPKELISKHLNYLKVKNAKRYSVFRIKVAVGFEEVTDLNRVKTNCFEN